MRASDDRVVAGVLGGVARRLRVDAFVLRLAVTVLALAGGAGIVLYLVLWGLTGNASPTEAPTDPAEPELGPQEQSRQTLAVGLVTFGLLLLFRDVGLWLGDALVWPLATAAAGSALLWSRSSGDERERWSRWSRLPAGPIQDVLAETSRGQVLGGAGLILAGLVTLVAINATGSALQGIALAVLVTTLGIGLVFGPWFARLMQQAAHERRERIRSEERAEIAAHLHDSVLQTLALIQRSDDPRRMSTLARQQERELRAWLYGGRDEAQPATLESALLDATAAIERDHDVTVQTVVVGDTGLDDRLTAVVGAVREAVLNAAKHSGASEISVYVEVHGEAIEAFVHDRGRGFDPSSLPDDRRGISESIVARMRRHGGHATITSSPGFGTEIELVLPRSGPPKPIADTAQ